MSLVQVPNVALRSNNTATAKPTRTSDEVYKFKFESDLRDALSRGKMRFGRPSSEADVHYEDRVKFNIEAGKKFIAAPAEVLKRLKREADEAFAVSIIEEIVAAWEAIPAGKILAAPINFMPLEPFLYANGLAFAPSVDGDSDNRVLLGYMPTMVPSTVTNEDGSTSPVVTIELSQTGTEYERAEAWFQIAEATGVKVDALIEGLRAGTTTMRLTPNAVNKLLEKLARFRARWGSMYFGAKNVMAQYEPALPPGKKEVRPQPARGKHNRHG